MKILLYLGFLCLALVPTLAIYEKDKGLNDWHLEHLGSINSIKFLEDSNLFYTISSSSGSQN